MDQDEELSLEEFRKWYSHDSSVAVTTVLDEGSSKMTLEETRRVSKLNKFTFSEIKEVLEAGSNSNGTISRDAFLDCFAEIAGCCDDAKEMTVDDEDEFRIFVSNLYNVFDTDRNGILDTREILSGLSVLCTTLPNEENKIDSTFSLYDTNGDGTISYSEMITYLHAVFKIMCETSDAGEEDQDPLNLARTTATSVFEEADVDRNGKITLNEFRAWASQSDSSASKIDNLRKTAVRRMSMNSLRSLTHLNAYPVRVAFTAFANHADEHGLITRSEFVKCLKSLSAVPTKAQPELA